MNFLSDSRSNAFDDRLELSPGHYALLWPGDALSGDGAHTLRGLEDGVMNLEALLFAGLVLALALEARRELVGPALKTGIDGLEIDTGVAADTVTKLGP